MFNNPLTIYGFVFVATLIIADTALRFIFRRRRRSQEVRNRLESIKQKSGAQVAYHELLVNRGIEKRNGKISTSDWFRKLVIQSGLEINTPRRILYLFFIFVIGYIGASYFLTPNPYFCMVFAAIFTPFMALFIIQRLRGRRIKVFTRQLPPAIDIIVRSLNAGHPLTAAISLVAREMPDPIGSEFGVLSDQMTFGAELDQAMLHMIDRVGAPELNLLAVTVSVQRGTGGNLSEILENLAGMIRDRLMIKAKIQAISAEGRATSWIMLAFPFLLFFMIRFLVPTYFDLVWASGHGTLIVGGCLFMIFLGMVVIRRLINFDF